MSAAATPTPEPPTTLSDPRELLGGYLDYYRAAILRKLDGLSEHELRSSRLPSGWTPLALLKHLAYVELRWLRWGFLGEPVESPFADHGPDNVWHVGPEETTGQIRALFERECESSRRIVAAAGLEDVAPRGQGRFQATEQPPALIWILFHLLQEYARHAGQLDVVRELADGVTGE